jgi:hypothetical protein
MSLDYHDYDMYGHQPGCGLCAHEREVAADRDIKFWHDKQVAERLAQPPQLATSEELAAIIERDKDVPIPPYWYRNPAEVLHRVIADRRILLDHLRALTEQRGGTWEI